MQRYAQTEMPAWDVFERGCPEGDSPAGVSERVDRVTDNRQCWLRCPPVSPPILGDGITASLYIGYTREALINS